jgi:hypothetical protein
MDPITAINLEFARRVQADWSRQAGNEQGEPATPAPHTRLLARLRVLARAGWVVSHKWAWAEPIVPPNP